MDAPPSPAQNLSVELGDYSFVVSWDEPASWGGSTLSAYLVNIGLADVYGNVIGGSATLFAATDTQITITSFYGGALDPDSVYLIEVAARSQFSLNSPSVRTYGSPTGKPPAPNVTVRYGADAQNSGQVAATVIWSPAFSVSVSAYLVNYGGTVSETAATQTVIVGLVPGSSHTIGIAAANSYGAGATAAFVFTAALPPTSVQNVSVDAGGNRRLVVSWSEPASWGGSTLSVYRISLVRLGVATLFATADTQITITAHNGAPLLPQTYSLQIFARSQANLNGPVYSTLVAPNSVPDAPGVVASALASGSQLFVSWSAANTAAHNTAATAYALHMGSVSATLGGGITSTVIGNLQVSTAYTLSVWALSPIGAGAAAVAGLTIPVFAPAAPQSLTAVAFVDGASLSWSAPAVNGGATITGYVLTYGDVSQTLAATATAATVGLLAGRQYAFTLQAGNAAGLGAGATAAASLARVAPFAPVSLQAIALSLAARLVWQTPAHDGGAPITNYVVSYGAITANLSVALTATITGLTAGEEYAFTLRAQNSLGLGAAATAGVSLSQGEPGAPLGFVAAAFADGRGASLSWSAPAFDGGVAITGYVLVYGAASLNLSPTTAATLGGLTPGEAYAFTLRAVNGVGLGAAAFAAASLPNFPGAPLSLSWRFYSYSYRDADQVASLSWSAPAFDGGATLTGYALSYGANTINLAAAATATVIQRDDQYRFTLRAANAVGLGAGGGGGKSAAKPRAKFVG